MMARLLMLLLIYVNFALCSEIDDILKKPVDPQEIVDDFNSARRELAVSNHIANMWKLKWDKELVKEAKNLTKECSKLEHGTDYRYFLGPSNANAVNHEKKVIRMFQEDQYGTLIKLREFGKGDIGTLEAMFPKQTRIGCIAYFCNVTWQDVETKKVTEFHYGTLCLVGPRNSISFYDFKSGYPGSRCGDGFDDDGLCAGSFSISLFVSIITVFFAFSMN